MTAPLSGGGAAAAGFFAGGGAAAAGFCAGCGGFLSRSSSGEKIELYL